MNMSSSNSGNKGSNSKKRILYQAGNLLYLAGWALTLIGLALIQDECKDHVRSTGSQMLGYDNIAFFVEPVGRDCNKGYRFFWFVWALSSIPPLLAIIASIKPDLARGVSSSFFAVVAPLTILMANSFYDATWLAKSDMEKRMEVVTTGFVVLGGASLLMLLLDSLLAGSVNSGSDKAVHHSDTEYHHHSTHQQKSVNLDVDESLHHTGTRAPPADTVVGVMPPVVGRNVPVRGANGAIVHEPVAITPVTHT